MKLKKMLSFLLAFAIIFTALPVISLTTRAETNGYYTYNTSVDGRAYIIDVDTSISGTVTIPSSFGSYRVVGISEYAFASCSKITHLIIPEGISYVGDSAFRNCSGLVNITIPRSLSSFGTLAFTGCSKLENVYISDIASWCRASFSRYDEYPSSHPMYFAENLYVNGKLSTSITIPSGVTSIGVGFARCESITEIVIPDTVESIAAGAFECCTSIQSLTLPFVGTSRTATGKGAFLGCLFGTNGIYNKTYTCGSYEIPYSLKNIILNCEKVPASAFSGIKLESATITDKVTSIGSNAFYNCNNLASVNMSESVQSIGDYAFYNCRALTSITIPNSVTTIGRGAFSECSSLNRVNITDIQAWCNIDFGDSVSNPLYYAKNLYLNGDLVSDLFIPDTVTKIGDYAFLRCNILSVTIPDSVTTIGDMTFGNCENLNNISIGTKVEKICDNAFIGCKKLVNISVSNDNTNFCSLNGVLYNKDCTVLRLYPIGIADICELPSGVEDIHSYAFYNCSNLTQISIQKSLKNIYENAFYGCNNLTDVKYEGSVSDKENISIVTTGNSCLLSATWHYNACINHSYSGNCDDRCNNCDSIRTVTQEHIFEWVIDKAESCVEDGYKHEECTGCHLKQNENTVIKATGSHLYINSWDTICSICGAERDATGTTGDVNWQLSGTTLTISGMGNMADYTFAQVTPWGKNITKIIINKGVTSIGNRAFLGITSLKEVEIADSVANIGEAAFANCTSLETIDIPDSVTSIGDWAFEGCSSLEFIELPKGLTKLNYALFDGCSNLRTVIIPDSVTTVDHWVFNNCTSLTNVAIPKNVTTVGSGMFSGCESLKTITIPASLTSISPDMFIACFSLTEVIIENKLTTVGEYAFHSCKALKDVWYVGSETDKNKISVSQYNDKLLSATWHYNICSVHTYANDSDTTCNVCGVIRNLSGVSGKCNWDLIGTTLIIRGNGDMLSYNSSSIPWGRDITEVIILDGVTSIGNYAFYGCSNLSKITIPDSVTKIGLVAFGQCVSLLEVKIPKGVTSISSGTFDGCTSLKNVTIPSSVTEIGNRSFYNCSELTEITIPEGVASIGGFTFYKCRSLTKVNVLGRLDSIGDSAFYSCDSLTEFNMPKGAAYISRYAFYYCTDLKEINLTDNATYIGDCAFRACGSLKKINIPDSVAYIGTEAFYGCTSLKEVNIPDKITAISDSAFRSCSSLTKVTIPSTVTTIGKSAFDSCSALTEINLSDSIEAIGDFAFYGCSSASKIELPSTVTSIGNSAFYACSSLTQFTVPSSVTSIGEYTFFNCQALKEITIPNGLKTIGNFAFYQCTLLKEISLPKAVTFIGERAFDRCFALNDVWYDGTLEDKGKIDIGAYNSALDQANWHYVYKDDVFTFTVSNGEAIITACKTDASGEITVPHTIADCTVVAINDKVFNGCSAITQINIPSSVEYIGNNVFDGCSALERIEVDKNNKNYCSSSGVLYSKDEKEIICTPENQMLILKVNYLYFTGETAFDTSESKLKAGDSYNAVVPQIEWHSVSRETVSGSMPDVDLTIDVIYYENAKINNGKCNDNITWTLYEDGSLIFRGTGDMPDYTSGSAPWSKNAHSINTVYIDPRIKSIGAYALENAINLTYIDYGYSISSIGKYAFSGCSSLKSFKLPETVTKIEEGAFYSCTGLKTVMISEEITSIGANAFNGCSELIQVTIGANVTIVGDSAFDNCQKLTQIYFRGKPAELGNASFGSKTGKYIYYYSTVDGWDEVIENGLWYGYTAIPYNLIAKENFDGTNVYIIKVVDKYNMPLQNAVVSLGENVQSTNSDGMAFFIKPQQAQSLSVSCSDHITFTDSAFNASKTQIIDIIELSDRPSVVQGVRVNDDSIATSVKIVNSNSGETLNIAVSGYSKYKIIKYELYQANRLIATKKTKDTSCVFSVKASAFEEGETIFVKMHTSDGYATSSALNIDIIKLAEISDVQLIDEFKNLNFAFSFGSLGNYKIPMSFTPTGEEKFYTYVNGRTIRVGINLDIGDYFKKNGDDAPKSALVKMVDQAMKTYKKPKNSIEYNVCGYIEIEYLGNGEYYVKTNYVKLSVAAKLSFNAQASFYGIVGVYFKAEVSGEAALDIKISRFEPQEGFGVEDLNFAMEDTIKLEGGAYLLWGIGSAGLYGKGTMGFVLGLIPEVEFESVYISGEFGAKWSLLWGLWSGKKVIASGDIYRWPQAQNYMMRMMATSLYEAQQDPDSYEITVREYLNKRSDWLNGDYLQKNIYDNVAPKIVNLGEEKIMLWLDDNSQRSTSDFQTLYYSVYKNGAWTEPVPVYDNGTFDCEFDLYTDGEKVYVIYTEKTNKNSGIETLDIGDEESISSFIKDVEVSVIVYENGKFGKPTQITDNTQCEILPKISLVDGEVTVVWVQTSEMGTDGYTKDNTISYAVLSDGGWTNPAKHIVSKNSVSDITNVSLNGKTYTVYITDSNGENETRDDLILVLSDKNGNSVQLDKGVIENVETAEINGKTVLTWYNNGRLYMITQPNESPISLLPDDVLAGTNYQFVSVGENSTMLTFIMGNYDKQGNVSNGNDIYGVYVDEKGCLSAPVRLTNTEGYVVNYSVCFYDGKLITVFTETFAEVIGDDVQTVTHLRNKEIEFYTDITLDGVDYDLSEIKADTNFKVTLNVSNNGTSEIDGITVNIYDVNGELVYTEECSGLIKSGYSHKFDILALIPSVISVADYNIEVLPKTLNQVIDDANISDNKYDVNFAYSDFLIKAEQKIIGESNYLIVSVENKGNVPSDAVIELYAPNVKGEKLSEIETGIIEIGVTQQYIVELSSLIKDRESVAVRVVSTVYDPFAINNTETLTLLKINNDVFTKDPEQIISNPEISANSAIFDKYAPNDISFEITKEAESFTGIEGLVLNQDYSISDNVIVISKDYISGLKVGSHTLNIVFDFGNEMPITRTLSVIVKDSTPRALTGNVEILGDAVVENTVYADLSNLNCNNSYLAYSWTVDGIEVSKQSSYQISLGDYGKTLRLTVMGINGFEGELFKEVTVSLKTPLVPSAPIISKTENDSFAVIKTEGVEYSIDLISWQDSNVFIGLLPNQIYTVYARIKATETSFASEISKGTTVTTLKNFVEAPNSPTIEAITDTSVTLVANDGYEYSMDGINWQKEAVFEGLTPDMEYTFYQRTVETDTAYASDLSEALIVKTEKILEFILGDLNGDNLVNTVDLAVMKLYLVGLSQLDEAGMFAGDFNNDKQINTTDLAILKLMLVGLA